jgi:hypothetical protein
VEDERAPQAVPSGGKEPAEGGEAPGHSLRRLERSILLSGGLIFAAIAAAAAAGAASFAMLPGAACGAAVAYGNFFLIRKILEKAFAGGGAVRKRYFVSYAVKFLVLVGAVYWIVRSGWFDMPGFLLGLSSLFLGILLEAVTRSTKTG